MNYQAKEELHRADALLAAYCIEAGDHPTARKMLERLESETYSNNNLATKVMAKALLGICLRNEPSTSDQGFLKLEESKQLRATLTPSDEKRPRLILPPWRFFDFLDVLNAEPQPNKS